MSKWMLVLICSFLIAAEWPAHAQSVPMQQAGMEPLTDTIIIHDFPGIPPARKVENLAVQILDDNRIVVAWEDDLSQIGSGWVMLTPEGKLITKGIRSFQKQDGSYSSLMGMFAPKLKANLFGPGFLFAATYYDWHGKDAPQNTIPDFLELSENDDAPVVQRVRNDGEFSGPFVTAFPLDFMKRPGPLRLADIELLSDGNYAVLTQSYQQGDGTFFKRPHAETVVLVTIVSPQGNVLHGPVCVQQEDRTAEAWHGLAVGEGCFGVKYVSGYTQIRFFRNNLIPLTDAIVIDPTHHLQDRGDASGWHGNGKDRFLQVSPTGINTSAKGAYANVFNAQGERLIETCHFAPADEIIYGGCDGR